MQRKAGIKVSCHFSGFRFTPFAAASPLRDSASHFKQMKIGDKMRSLAVLLLAGALIGSAAAQSTTTTTTDQGAGQDMKDAAHSTAHATKKTAHKVKRGTKKVVHKSAEETRKGADKVADKTETKPQ